MNPTTIRIEIQGDQLLNCLLNCIKNLGIKVQCTCTTDDDCCDEAAGDSCCCQPPEPKEEGAK